MIMPLSITKNGLLLFVFALVTAGILAFTHEGTKDTIAAAERKAAEKALLEIIPKSRFDNDLLLDTLQIPESAHTLLGTTNDDTIYVARKNKQVIAVIIPAIAPDGYSGEIKLIAGINIDGSIAGVRVLRHKETPGIGDKVDIKKSQWITGFNDKSLNNPTANRWKVKKNGGDFDQFTGATITPRAIVNRVYKVLTFVDNNQTLLFPNKPTAVSK
jgi:Na+-translocating ferredoxin:NAD+ oxidoreductase subunit G